MSEKQNPDQYPRHKRTQKRSECDLITNKKDEDDTDPVVEKLSKIGCLESHYKVQDCYFETKDWRKCTNEVQEFQNCIKLSKKNSQP